MIYFLINNNYHHVDVMAHVRSLDGEGYSVIEIPHHLDGALDHPGVHATHHFIPPTTDSIFARLKQLKASIADVRKRIVPSEKDVLFFYTEYEVLNIHVAEIFKKAGARVYLIEDGGLGTYVPFRQVQSETLSVKDLVKRTLYRHFLGMPRLDYFKLNGHVFPRTSDETIDAVCLYKPVAIRRKIDVQLIARGTAPIENLIAGRVVFLNEPIYETYQDDQAYLAGLRGMLEGLTVAYPEILFKFHPRETAAWRARIRDEVLAQFPSLTVMEENAPIELLAETYRPQVLASYFCSALLSLAERGIEPLYLFHLVPELARQPAFKETGVILKELGYAFVSSYAAIKRDYCSGIADTKSNTNAIPLAEVVTPR